MATIYFNNGQRYEGDVNRWEEPDGRGTLYYTNGDVFDGWFSNGKMSSGKATLRHRSGTTISGDFNGDDFSGDVDISYSNGDRYSGSYSSFYDAPHGFGYIKYSNGDAFDGEFDSGSPKQGRFYFYNGDEFDGEFTGGGYSEGKMTYVGGNVFIGKFYKGAPYGEGEIRYPGGGSELVKIVNGRIEPLYRKETTEKVSRQTSPTQQKSTPKVTPRPANNSTTTARSYSSNSSSHSKLYDRSARREKFQTPAFIGVLAIFVLDIILVFALKDATALCRWLWLPLIGMAGAVGSAFLAGLVPSKGQGILKTLSIIWGIARGIILVVAYFAAASGWKILGAIFFFMIIFCLNAIAYFVAIDMYD